ncbi:MAG TPA: cytochrome c biogenesis protein CcsA [Planctomycetaceae bacterium]|nr:cytochrome c biogenesis protein CcsA [Planctomycetaceae bacterium]
MPIDLDKVSVFCFLASYTAAFGLEWTRLVRRGAIARWAGLALGLAGFVAQSAYLLVRSRGHENLLLSSTHDWLLVLAWIVVLLYLFLTTIDRELAVGLFLLPVVLLFVGSSYFVSKQTNSLIAGSRGFAMLHASLLVIGIAGIIASFVLSLMYVVQHRRLKQHHAQQPGVALPSLARLARWNWWAIVVSVPLLTLGLGSGVALGLTSPKAAAAFSFADPVVIGYGVVGLVMIALFVRLLTTRRSTGKQVAALTLWAGGFLLAILIGLQVLTGRSLSSFHTGQAGPTLPRSPANPIPGKLFSSRARMTLTRSVSEGERFTGLFDESRNRGFALAHAY